MTNKNFFIEQLKETGEWKVIFSFHGYQAAEYFYFRCVNKNPGGNYRLKSRYHIIYLCRH
jgi:hypothetical protein